MEDQNNLFTEKTEDIGLKFNSYKKLLGIITSFTDTTEHAIKKLIVNPKKVIPYGDDDIEQFKKDIDINVKPGEIDIKRTRDTYKMLKKFRKSVEDISNRYTKLRDKISFGGNYIRAILRRPKVYSTEIDGESYVTINRNVRNINRGMDWIEKSLMELFNLVDHDINTIRWVDKVYGKHKIYEEVESEEDGPVLDMSNPEDPEDDGSLEEEVVDFNESWIIVEDNLEINMSDWKKGNPLWITGSSGDGKSTLAEKMAKKHNAKIVTSDIVLCRMGWTKEKFEKMLNGGQNANAAAHKIEFKDSPALDYVLSHPELPYEAKDPKTRCFKSEITAPEMIKFYHWLMKELKDNPKYSDELYLIEGCDICLLDPKLMSTKPLIIVGGPRLRSLYRRAKRDSSEKNGSIIASIFKYIKKYVGQRSLDDNKESFRKAIKRLLTEGANMDDDNLDWVEGFLMEEGENDPPEMQPEQKESMPKKTDKAESDKNGVRRKKLYIAFIEWAKTFNSKNTFGSIFDKDAFKISYPFVPEEMRYFYRLANPILCVLSGNLTFFQVSELRKLNAKNSRLDTMIIFAATQNDMRVFNKQDKKVYRGTEENGAIKLNEVLGNTFDTYLQNMINQGDILNAPLEEDNNSTTE